MKLYEIAAPAIATVVGTIAGYEAGSSGPSPNLPIDNTGRTSIIVDYDNEGWCELRGPARYRVLDEWEAYDGYAIQPVSAAYKASSAIIRNGRP